jgi:hypothetical protein
MGGVGTVKFKIVAWGIATALFAPLAWSQTVLAPSQVYAAAGRDAVRIMSSEKIASNPHLIWTEMRPDNEADRLQAEEIVLQLRAALKDYKDYRVAEQDGYHPYLSGVDMPQHHFTNDRFSLIGSLWFRPSKPNTLLYKQSGKGYELLGALYTASQFATEAELNRRVPLSVARWHAHINICMPPESEFLTADWKQYGLEGSIVAEQDCAAAGGTFYPQLFGWMLRVYPFEKSPGKIWAH